MCEWNPATGQPTLFQAAMAISFSMMVDMLPLQQPASAADTKSNTALGG